MTRRKDAGLDSRLPPLNALKAFEAAARRLNITRAAEELAVTPGAVSQQIRILEEHAGAPLFHREGRQIALTELGADKFDYLVNNAGYASGMGFLNATEAEFDALYRIHVKSVFFLSQKLLPLLADGGRIVNVSSGLTRIVMANRAPYAIMKSAVETLTRYMAFELGSRGITVNCVAPGAIATDFSGGVVRDNPQVAQAVANMTALGRPGLPEDIGPMIASLLSDDHRWVNAQRIEVSGGMRI